MAAAPRNQGGDLPFARELFEAADRMRGSVELAEYKHERLVGVARDLREARRRHERLGLTVETKIRHLRELYRFWPEVYAAQLPL